LSDYNPIIKPPRFLLPTLSYQVIITKTGYYNTAGEAALYSNESQYKGPIRDFWNTGYLDIAGEKLMG